MYPRSRWGRRCVQLSLVGGIAAVASCTGDPAASPVSSSTITTISLDSSTTNNRSTAPAIDFGTLPPAPEGVDELVVGLPSSDRAGVPDDWFILDLDPALVDDPAYEGDLDAFRGLIDCPSSSVRGAEIPWLARRFTLADTALDNGVLSVEVIVQLQDAAAHEEQLARLRECVAVSDGTELDWSESEVVDDATPDAVGVATDVLQILGEPDDQTPFPYAVVSTWVQRGDFSVGAVVGGQPPSDAWGAISERLAVDALLALEAG